MSNDKTETVPQVQQEASRLDIHDDDGLRYWSNKFGVTADELRAAVRCAGTYVKAIEADLKTRSCS